MAELRRLQPHDPVPEGGRYLLVLRRFGEDEPGVVVTEIIEADGKNPPALIPAVRSDGKVMELDEAIGIAQSEAERRRYGLIYAVDRTAGRREHEVMEHHGDRSVGMERLADTDPEDGEEGTDLRDRPADAGYNLTPHR